MSEVMCAASFRRAILGLILLFFAGFCGTAAVAKKVYDCLDRGSFWIRLHGGGLRHFSFAHPFPDNL